MQANLFDDFTRNLTLPSSGCGRILHLRPVELQSLVQPQDDWNIGATILSSGHNLYHGSVGFFQAVFVGGQDVLQFPKGAGGTSWRFEDKQNGWFEPPVFHNDFAGKIWGDFCAVCVAV